MKAAYSVLAMLPKHTITTQKARGIKHLLSLFSLTIGVNTPAYSDAFLYPKTDLPTDWERREWFARPCPTVPRHGFVDSRVVRDAEEVIDLYREVINQDPGGEIVLMPKLSGKVSGVAVNTGVTWGLGNDGVTGGKADVKHIPTPSGEKSSWNYWATGRYSLPHELGIQNLAYVELVAADDSIMAVQLRDGPEQPTTPDFIPETTRVTNVLVPNWVDLLTWEKEILNQAGVPGVVINLPGGSLASHYAVHGIASNIPVITSRTVGFGDVIQKDATERSSMSVDDYLKLAAIIRNLSGVPLLQHKRETRTGGRNLLTTAIASVHSMTLWDGSAHLLALRAWSVHTIILFILAACLGELRHWRTSGPGSNGERRATRMPRGWGSLPQGGSRQGVYERVLTQSLTLAQAGELYATLAEDFDNVYWASNPGDFDEDRGTYKEDLSYGYGGPGWRDIARGGGEIVKRTHAFLADPTERNWAKVVMAMNTVVNLAHNNGKVVSKWLETGYLDRIANFPVLGLMNMATANIVYPHLRLGMGGSIYG